MKLTSLALRTMCAVSVSVLLAGPALARQPAPSPVQVVDAAATASAVTVTATIAAVDARNHVVTLKGSEGNARTTVVSNIWAMNTAQGTVTVLDPYGHLTEVHLKDPALLNGVKVGDQMKITYTQAVATSVVKKA